MHITSTDWIVRPLKITDRTIIQRYLPKRIPTTLAMHRRAAKI
jgi:hypothetical protein